MLLAIATVASLTQTPARRRATLTAALTAPTDAAGADDLAGTDPGLARNCAPTPWKILEASPLLS